MFEAGSELRYLNKSADRQNPPTHLVEQLPAEVPSQQAVQRLLIPAEGHPAEMLLQPQLGALQPRLRQRADQEAALAEMVGT